MYLHSVCQLIFLHNVVLQFDKLFAELQTNQLRGRAEHVTLNTHTLPVKIEGVTNVAVSLRNANMLNAPLPSAFKTQTLLFLHDKFSTFMVFLQQAALNLGLDLLHTGRLPVWSPHPPASGHSGLGELSQREIGALRWRTSER